MRVWLTQTILAQLAEILPQNGPVDAKRAGSGIVSQKIKDYRKDPPKVAWGKLGEVVYR